MAVKEPKIEDFKKKILELELEISELKKKQYKVQDDEDGNTQLLASHRRILLDSILNTTPYTFVVKDKNSVYVEANKSFCEFLGKTEEEIIGKTDYDFFPANEAKIYIKGDKAVMSGQPQEKEEWEVLGASGLKWLKVVKTALYSEFDKKNAIGVLCSVTDISHQKKAEISLIENEKKLRELNAMKDSFLSIIGHDLKTPLSNIIGFSELTIENIEKFDIEKIKKFLKIILDSANKSFLLLSDLLEWSRSQSGKIQIRKEPVNLNNIITTALEITSDSYRKKKIKIDIICNKELTIESDKYILSTVIRNLLSNAIKFSNIGGSVKIICSELRENEIKKGVKIIVEDEGVGISSANLKTLFKINKTITTKGTNGEVGTGLGLILCKEFLEKIGGKIKVESHVGKGSKFIIILNNEYKGER